jgi:enamine deaminase RidA (YjgF/YER057c/UK114 family)
MECGWRSVYYIHFRAGGHVGGRWIVHEDDFRDQVRLTFENFQTVLKKTGASLGDVVKPGIYFVDMGRLLARVAQVQAEFF